ncbi:MAG: hypothetical protein K0R17_529 [Rariglobus sp.]|jgi:hypothetical protein|nr:hypothetical protein [Rariglobus sp.]
MREHVIRAAFTDTTVRVYQAYTPDIALPALKAGRFVPPFKMSRMTWIKPSFNWMMYRSGFAKKPGQEVVLGIDITRAGFDWALDHAVLCNFNERVHGSHEYWKHSMATKCVRVQWDPERDWRLNPIAGARTIQIGLSGQAMQHYVSEWIVNIEDITCITRILADAVATGIHPQNTPDSLERPYPVSSRYSHILAEDEQC